MKKSPASFFPRLWKRLRIELRWFIPGMGVKRWIVLILFGITLIGVGLAFFILDVYRTAPETWWLPALSMASLRFLSRPVRITIFAILGIGTALVGFWGLNRSILQPFVRPGKRVIETVSNYRRKERGPRIVVIGGGTGLSALIRGLKAFTHNLTAVVTVADDGGSSGELRRTLGILPPGDIRSCLAALSDDEDLMTQLFQYRFPAGAGLNGHSFGNLFITALTDMSGSFEEAVAESGRVLSIHGQVLPATLHDVRLVADMKLPEPAGDFRVNGESKIAKAHGKVRRIWLEPDNPPAFPPAIQAVLSADLIVIGPGSLYTSIIPNLLVHDLTDAIRVSKAPKFYVCNVATEPGETDDYTCGDHLRALINHMGVRCLDLVIANVEFTETLPANISWVRVEDDLEDEWPVYRTGLADAQRPWRHNSGKLAQVVMDLFYERTGPLINKDDV